MIAGRYTLEREIGRGGMGAVWLARDEVLGRLVALKRIGLLPGADSTDLARAEREARLAAQLNHPHVVAVFDVVVDPDTGGHWLVMEYVDGTTLARLVADEGRLSPDHAAPLLRQAADALVAAHAAGIVHRDVKPSNILVEPSGRVRLTDFGIARVAADPALTQTGLVVGSPGYLAPEVATGHRGDEAADVWSLGATAFYVLSGRPPYETGDHVLGALYRIVNEEPPQLDDAGWMTPLLEATMAKDPSRRWSMAQVRDFLAGTMPAPQRGTGTAPAGEGKSSTRLLVPDGAVPAPRRPAGASPRRAGVLVVLVLALVAAVVVAALLLQRGPSTTSAGNRPSSSPSPSRSSSPSVSPSATRSSTPAKTRKPAAPRPTAAGMESFIRRYVAALGSDPETAWHMLTPRFQRESGGLATYRRFWSGVGRGHLLEITADPHDLVVSYRVRFDNFGTGRRPTVLKLVFHDGHYLIDGERTQGSTSSG
ncbi:MAG TPA: serine/threonine-protein kinase [Nocardioidaceae bacterium]|nr:serine/threonine-protein kinase [Nocardioidaceae bacterium]